MTDYARQILGLLLDRYERSAHYRGESRRSVFLRLDRATLPDYWDDTSADYRAEIHRVLAELAAAGLLQVHWARFNEGRQVDRVVLNLQRLEAAYRRAGRTPRRHLEHDLAATAAAWQGRLPRWAEAMVAALLAALAEGRPLPAGFTAADAGALDDVLRASAALRPGDPLPKRVFSLRVFGSSKHFEQRVEGRLVRVLREFHPAAGDHADRRELLAEVGVTENPDYLLLAGPLTLRTATGALDLAPFQPFAGLPASLLASAEVAALPVDQVMTVENLTTFHQLAAQGNERRLLIYLGGYHNRLRQDFLRRLWQAAPAAAFLHWGDIDLGGFRIFHLLATGSGVPLQAYRMDVDTYLAHAATGQPFDADYGRRLAALAETPGYEPFAPVIAEMLRLGRRVEQEAIPL